MPKYHISPKSGRPNICRATKRACPIAGANSHFNSKEAAKSGTTENAGSALTKTQSKPHSSTRVGPFQPPKTISDIPESRTPGEIASGLRYSKKNERHVILSIKEDLIHEELKIRPGLEDTIGGGISGEYKKVITALIASPNGELNKVVFESEIATFHDEGVIEHYPDSKFKVYELEKTGISGTNPELMKIKNHYNLPFLLQDNREAYGRDDWGTFGDGVGMGGYRRAKELVSKAVRDVGYHKLVTMSLFAYFSNNENKMKKEDVNHSSLVRNKDPRIRAAIAGRKELSKESIDILINDKERSTMTGLAGNPILKAEQFKKILSYYEPRDSKYAIRKTLPVEAMLKNLSLPVSIMKKIIKKGNIECVEVMSRNPSLHKHPQILEDCRKILY